MGTQKSKLPGGIMIPQFFHGDLEPVGTASTSSTYSQAGPRPGQAVADDALTIGRLRVSASQGVDFDVHCVRAGNPGTGAAFAIRLDSETGDDDWRGWDGTSLLSAWLPAEYTAGGGGLWSYSMVTIPSTQDTWLVMHDSVLNDVATTIYDPADLTETSVGALTEAGTWHEPAMVVLPGSERLLLFHGNNTYHEASSQWETYSVGIIQEDVSTFGAITAAVYRGSIILLIADSTAGTVHHYASSDLGASFQLVSTYTALGLDLDVKATRYGLAVSYITGTSRPAALKIRILSSAWEEIDLQDPIEITATTHDYSTLSVDEGGTLYVAAARTHNVRMYSSEDQGTTWTAWAGYLDTRGHTTDRITFLRSTWAMGRMMIAHRYSATTNTANAVGIMVGGGWSSATVGGPGSSIKTRQTWGIYQTGFTDGATWIPIELPANSGWASTGAGTVALASPGEITYTSTANTIYSSLTPTANTEAIVGQAQVLHTSGGSASSLDVGIGLRVADGVFDYEAHIRIHSTGYEVADANGATKTSVTRATSAQFQLRWEVNKGEAKVWDRDLGASKWNYAGSQSLTNDTSTPNAAGTIAWGHIGSGTAVSVWREFHFSSSIATAAATPSVSSGIAAVNGKSWTAHAEPIPDVGSGSAIAHMALIAGPVRVADTWTVAAQYDYSIRHIDPVESPSPAQTWRSTDLSEQLIVYDLGADSWIGDSIALYIGNANFRTAYIESWNGSAWVTNGTLDLADGFTLLKWSLDGRTGAVNAGATSDPDRYLWDGELSGAWAMLDPGASVHGAIDITYQSAGSWTDESTVHPTLTFSEAPTLAQGTLDADGATRTLHLVHRSGWVIVHPTTSVYRRYYRVRIPAGVKSTDTVGIYYEAGTIMMCRVVPFGAQFDWGYSDEMIPSLDVTVDAAGTRHAKQRGTPGRTMSVSLTALTGMVEIRSGTDLDYVAGTSGIPLTAHNDVGQMAQGLFRQTESGAIPVVFVEAFPKVTGTVVTDPSLFLFGHMTGTARINNVSGDLGIDEVTRVEAITFVELV